MKDIKTGLENILNEASLKEINPSGFKFISVDKIFVNEFNAHRQTHEDILRLKESIEEYGLMMPLKVKRNKNGNYTLIAGEGRFKALSMLDEYTFNGATHSTSEIPVMIDKTNRDEDDENIAIILANAQKEESKEYKLIVIKKLLKIFYKKKENNNFKEYETKNKRTWLAMVTGYSESSIRDYLKVIEGDDSNTKAKQTQTISKDIDKYLKNMKFNQSFIENWEIDDINNELEDDVINYLEGYLNEMNGFLAALKRKRSKSQQNNINKRGYC